MRIAVVCAAVALMWPAAVPAQQDGVPANQRFCLDEVSGGHDGGGTQPLMCRFTTMDQCNASKTGPSDRCILNPIIGVQPRR